MSGNLGATWKLAGHPSSVGDAGQGWNDLGFTTTHDGVVIHGHPQFGDMLGQLLLTGNGGRTWHAVRF